MDYFTRVTKLQQRCSKYHICTILLKFAQEQTDIELDLLSVAMAVNATFAQDLHLCAENMRSHECIKPLHIFDFCVSIPI